jgi:hypothetical protein
MLLALRDQQRWLAGLLTLALKSSDGSLEARPPGQADGDLAFARPVKELLCVLRQLASEPDEPIFIDGELPGADIRSVYRATPPMSRSATCRSRRRRPPP